MANSMRSLCNALKGFVMVMDKKDNAASNVFRGILFDGEYAYASDTRVAVKVSTKRMGFDIPEPVMCSVGGAVDEELDPEEFPDFKVLLEDKRFTQNKPTVITGLQESSTTAKWVKTLNFIRSSIHSHVRAVVLEKRGRELLVFSRNSAVKIKTVLCNKLQGGEDITMVVSAKYLAAVANILDYLECDRCEITFTGGISSTKINGCKRGEVLCTVVLAPINAKNAAYNDLIAFRDRDKAGYVPAVPEADDIDDLFEDDEDWDFLGEE